MTEYTKQVFKDPELLRQKLAIYLNTLDKAEIYAKSAECFFKAGEQEELKMKPTWSWWTFFFGLLFFAYRCNHQVTLSLIVFHALGDILSAIIHSVYIPFMLISIGLHIFVVMYAKFFVIKRFEKILQQEDDKLLEKRGVSIFAVVLYFILSAVIFFGVMSAIIATQNPNILKG